MRTSSRTCLSRRSEKTWYQNASNVLILNPPSPEKNEVIAEIPAATLRRCKKCYGKAYGHNSWIPTDNWLTDDFVKISGMTHVRTSPFYPQSNGKIERYHRTVKSRCIRPATPLSIDDARRAVDRFVTHDNTTRLHSAIGYVTPLDMLEGRQKSILEARDRKLEEARLLRGEKRRQQKLEMPKTLPARPHIPEVDSSVRREDRATLGSAPSA